MAPGESASGERRFLLLVLLGGLALRLIWLEHMHGLADFAGLGEATREALSVAHGRGFSDPYFDGQGPSAHLLPVMPAIAGGVLALFGPGSVSGNIALLVWSLAQSLCAWLLLHRLFARLGMPAAALRWAMVLLCLVPVFASHEIVDFRWWEGAASLCLLCLNLLLLIQLDAGNRLAPHQIAAIAAISAATFLVSPPVGLAAAACWAVHALRRLPARQTLLLAVAATGAFALLLGPWAVRNSRVLGTPVMLRSNFGLELALANHPAAASPASPRQVFTDRLQAIHPYHSAGARAAMVRAGGEVPYSKALGREAGTWITRHPSAFAQLYLRHISELFFPRPWQMYFTDTPDLAAVRAAVISAVNLIGLIALAFGLAARRRFYWAIALCIAVIALPYGLVQPVPRYTYLVYGLLAFPAVEAVGYLSLMFRRKAQAGRDRQAAAPRAFPGRPCRGSAR